ncbi:hypothetical protein DGo_PA0143 (plasmid) [Deinococcus gobiensis I-0]|uniref:Uncharacterized protein n=1 Tax=Deinococcus gobiensis (strain DSM 21396 / JCM 16679 / CGMCC 1.7299 / I-0) TaxID=745776 RepID=H8H110_DEIGI|nr:hypothetical protein DGo_PA0143 [Deinococcus gobiensis I-0]
MGRLLNKTKGRQSAGTRWKARPLEAQRLTGPVSYALPFFRFLRLGAPHLLSDRLPRS